jgi:hypothetical protein
MAVKSCPTCGRDDTGERDFCAGCGSYLRWEEDPEDTDTAVLTPATDVEPRREPASTASTALERVPTAVPSEVEMAPVGLLADTPETVAAEPGVQVAVRVPGRDEDPAEVDVATAEPGGRAILTATVRNQSGIVEGFAVQVRGLPQEWCAVTPDVVHLVPLGAGSGEYEAQLEIAIAPPRSPEARAGAWPIEVVVVTHPEGKPVASAPARIIVGAYRQFESRIRPERARGAGSARFSVPVRNLGNAPLQLRFRAEDADGEVSFSFDPPQLEVAAGEEDHATVTASAQQPAMGAERERRLTVFVDAPGQTLSGNAVFVQRPRATPGRLTLWRVLAALFASALLIGSAFMDWTDSALQGVCLHAAEDCLRYDVFAENFLGFSDVGFVDAGQLTRLASFASSAGLVTIGLGVLVLLGLLRGAFAWVAGVLGVMFTVVLMLISDAGVGPGLWVALLGSLLAILAGVLASVGRRDAGR